MSDSVLTNFPMIGYQYTWFMSIDTSRAIEERSDRGACEQQVV